MIDVKDPTPPSSGEGAKPADSPVEPCTLNCPKTEVEINNTPGAKDDLVYLKCFHGAHVHKTRCRIRVKGNPPNDALVVLTNPDDRLRFPTPGDKQLSLTLPKSGAWVPFEISGNTKSDAIGDAVIEVHCGTATGEITSTKPVTVFWFDEAEIKITSGGNYTVFGGRYSIAGSNAVNYSAKATIKPTGVDCSAPQVKDLRIGIMQNDITNGVGSELSWDTPTIAWNPGTPTGTIVTVPEVIRQISTMSSSANDVAPTVDPLYDQPGKADTLDPNSLKPPMGCTGGAPATSFDTPSTPVANTFTLPATDTTGANVGNVTYSRFVKAKVIGSFTTWAVIWDVVKQEFCVIRQSSWKVNVDSSAAGAQKAVPAASDAAPTNDPVLAPTANTVINAPGNQSTAAGGPANKTFTAP